MAVRQQAGFRLDLELPILGRWQRKVSSPKHRSNGHDMRAAKQWVGLEIFEKLRHTRIAPQYSLITVTCVMTGFFEQARTRYDKPPNLTPTMRAPTMKYPR
jgi:hypothetical protein